MVFKCLRRKNFVDLDRILRKQSPKLRIWCHSGPAQTCYFRSIAVLARVAASLCCGGSWWFGGRRRRRRRDNPVAGALSEIPVTSPVVHQAEVAPSSVRLMETVRETKNREYSSKLKESGNPPGCRESWLRAPDRPTQPKSVPNRVPDVLSNNSTHDSSTRATAPLRVLPSRRLGKTFPDPDRILTKKSLTRNCFLFLPHR